MTHKQAAAIMAVIAQAFPAFFAKKPADAIPAAVATWEAVMGDMPYDLVEAAVLDYIRAGNTYPPNSGQIYAEAQACRRINSGAPSHADLWRTLSAAAANSAYNARQTFDALPPILREYLRSPSELYRLGQMDADEFATWERRRFADALPELHRLERLGMLPPERPPQLPGGDRLWSMCNKPLPRAKIASAAIGEGEEGDKP